MSSHIIDRDKLSDAIVRIIDQETFDSDIAKDYTADIYIIPDSGMAAMARRCADRIIRLLNLEEDQ